MVINTKEHILICLTCFCCVNVNELCAHLVAHKLITTLQYQELSNDLENEITIICDDNKLETLENLKTRYLDPQVPQIHDVVQGLPVYDGYQCLNCGQCCRLNNQINQHCNGKCRSNFKQVFVQKLCNKPGCNKLFAVKPIQQQQQQQSSLNDASELSDSAFRDLHLFGQVNSHIFNPKGHANYQTVVSELKMSPVEYAIVNDARQQTNRRDPSSSSSSDQPLIIGKEQ